MIGLLDALLEGRPPRAEDVREKRVAIAGIRRALHDAEEHLTMTIRESGD